MEPDDEVQPENQLSITEPILMGDSRLKVEVNGVCPTCHASTFITSGESDIDWNCYFQIRLAVMECSQCGIQYGVRLSNILPTLEGELLEEDEDPEDE